MEPKTVSLRAISSPPTDIEAMHELNVERMKAGVSIFSFLKKDGSVRVAIGTLHPEHLDGLAHATEQSAPKPPTPHLQPFYDLVSKQWRTYAKQHILTIFDHQ